MNRSLLLLLIVLLPAYLFAHEDPANQIASMSQRIRENPNNAALYLQRGELYRVQRNWKEALADYQRAEILDPELTVVQLCRGKLYLETEQFDLAKSALKRFLTSYPDHPDALASRARLLAKLGRHRDSANDFTRALLFDPKPEYYIERAQTLSEGGMPNYAEALRGLDEGITKLGPLVTLELPAIDLELKLQRYDAALARLNKLIQQAERKETWLVRKAEILRQASRPREARDAYAAALAAIEALPASMRNSKAMSDLKANVELSLLSLERLQNETTSVP